MIDIDAVVRANRERTGYRVSHETVLQRDEQDPEVVHVLEYSRRRTRSGDQSRVRAYRPRFPGLAYAYMEPDPEGDRDEGPVAWVSLRGQRQRVCAPTRSEPVDDPLRQLVDSLSEGTLPWHADGHVLRGRIDAGRLLTVLGPVLPVSREKAPVFTTTLGRLAARATIDVEIEVEPDSLQILSWASHCHIRGNPTRYTSRFTLATLSERERDSAGWRTLPAVRAEGAVWPRGFVPVVAPTSGGWKESSHCCWAQMSLDAVRADGGYHELFPPERFRAYDLEHYALQNNSAVAAPPWRVFHPLVVGAYWEDHGTTVPDWHGALGDRYFPYGHNWDRAVNHFGRGREGLRHYLGVDLMMTVTLNEEPDGAVPRQVELGPPLRRNGASEGDPTANHEYWYSTVAWGFGASAQERVDNEFTFENAVRAYATQSEHGVEVAYLMLGHVLHLLQDIGMPDHALNRPHPASGFTQHELFYGDPAICDQLKTMIHEWDHWFVHVLELRIPFLKPLLQAVVDVACRVIYDSDTHCGYERLVADRANVWRFEESVRAEDIRRCRAQVDEALRAAERAGEDRHTHLLAFDEPFRLMQNFAIAATAAHGFDTSPRLEHGILGARNLEIELPDFLGGDDLAGHIGFGLVPDIDIHDEVQVERYRALTEALVPEIIARGADLIRYFLEVVTPPPILERVAVCPVQSTHLDDRPRFGDGGWDYYAAAWMADWTPNFDDVPGWRALKRRRLGVSSNLELPPLGSARIWLQFGPNLSGDGKRVRTATAHLEWANERLEIPIEEVQLDSLEAVGYAWTGVFALSDTMRGEEVRLVVDAEDLAAHSLHGGGKALHSAPDVVVRPGPSDTKWRPQGYRPGPDTQHVFRVAAQVVEEDEYDLAGLGSRSAPIEVAIKANQHLISHFDATLTLHELREGGIDEDWFSVSYPSEPPPLQVDLDEIVGGSPIVHTEETQPARLEIACNDVGSNIDLTVTALDGADGRELTLAKPSDLQTWVLESPDAHLKGDAKRLLLRVSSTTAVRYTLRIHYRPAVRVVTHFDPNDFDDPLVWDPLHGLDFG